MDALTNGGVTAAAAVHDQRIIRLIQKWLNAGVLRPTGSVSDTAIPERPHD